MQKIFLALVITLFSFSESIISQRNHSGYEGARCRRSGKLIEIYSGRFIQVGMPFGMSDNPSVEYPSAGFTSGGLFKFGTYRYFGINIDRNRFDMGFYTPFTFSLSFWEDDFYDDMQNVKYHPYFFAGLGLGPVITVRTIDRLLVDFFVNARPTITAHNGIEYENNGVRYREFSKFAFFVGLNYGVNLRYGRAMIGFDVAPAKVKYDMNLHIDGGTSPDSPQKMGFDVSTYSLSAGVFF